MPSQENSQYTFSDGGATTVSLHDLANLQADGVDQFGHNVAIHGNVAAVLGKVKDQDPFWTPLIYIFERSQAGWLLMSTITITSGRISQDISEYNVPTHMEISDNIIVLGGVQAPAAYGGGWKNTVYIIEKDDSSGAWSLTGSITGSDAQTLNDYFGISVDVHLDTIVVGAPHAAMATGGNDSDGEAWVFTRQSNGNWPTHAMEDLEGVAVLRASDPHAHDYFGMDVAINNNLIVIGAPSTDGRDRGGVYFFEKDPATDGAWGTHAGDFFSGGSWYNESLKESPATNSRFGYRVSIDEEHVVVGSPGRDGGGLQDRGGIYIWDLGTSSILSGTPTFAHSLDPVVDGKFGSSIDISGNIIIVGSIESPHESGNTGEYNGGAYIFEKSGGTWQQTQKLLGEPYSANYHHYGIDVSIDSSSGFAIVGSDGKASTPTTNGLEVHIYEASGSGGQGESESTDTQGDQGTGTAGDGDTSTTPGQGQGQGQGQASSQQGGGETATQQTEGTMAGWSWEVNNDLDTGQNLIIADNMSCSSEESWMVNGVTTMIANDMEEMVPYIRENKTRDGRVLDESNKLEDGSSRYFDDSADGRRQRITFERSIPDLAKLHARWITSVNGYWTSVSWGHLVRTAKERSTTTVNGFKRLIEEYSSGDKAVDMAGIYCGIPSWVDITSTSVSYPDGIPTATVSLKLNIPQDQRGIPDPIGSETLNNINSNYRIAWRAARNTPAIGFDDNPTNDSWVMDNTPQIVPVQWAAASTSGTDVYGNALYACYESTITFALGGQDLGGGLTSGYPDLESFPGAFNTDNHRYGFQCILCFDDGTVYQTRGVPTNFGHASGDQFELDAPTAVGIDIDPFPLSNNPDDVDWNIIETEHHDLRDQLRVTARATGYWGFDPSVSNLIVSENDNSADWTWNLLNASHATMAGTTVSDYDTAYIQQISFNNVMDTDTKLSVTASAFSQQAQFDIDLLTITAADVSSVTAVSPDSSNSDLSNGNLSYTGGSWQVSTDSGASASDNITLTFTMGTVTYDDGDTSRSSSFPDPWTWRVNGGPWSTGSTPTISVPANSASTMITVDIRNVLSDPGVSSSTWSHQVEVTQASTVLAITYDVDLPIQSIAFNVQNANVLNITNLPTGWIKATGGSQDILYATQSSNYLDAGSSGNLCTLELNQLTGEPCIINADAAYQRPQADGTGTELVYVEPSDIAVNNCNEIVVTCADHWADFVVQGFNTNTVGSGDGYKVIGLQAKITDTGIAPLQASGADLGDGLVLRTVRNENYWRGNASGGNVPNGESNGYYKGYDNLWLGIEEFAGENVYELISAGVAKLDAAGDPIPGTEPGIDWGWKNDKSGDPQLDGAFQAYSLSGVKKIFLNQLVSVTITQDTLASFNGFDNEHLAANPSSIAPQASVWVTKLGGYSQTPTKAQMETLATNLGINNGETITYYGRLPVTRRSLCSFEQVTRYVGVELQIKNEISVATTETVNIEYNTNTPTAEFEFVVTGADNINIETSGGSAAETAGFSINSSVNAQGGYTITGTSNGNTIPAGSGNLVKLSYRAEDDTARSTFPGCVSASGIVFKDEYSQAMTMSVSSSTCIRIEESGQRTAPCAESNWLGISTANSTAGVAGNALILCGEGTANEKVVSLSPRFEIDYSGYNSFVKGSSLTDNWPGGSAVDIYITDSWDQLLEFDSQGRLQPIGGGDEVDWMGAGISGGDNFRTPGIKTINFTVKVTLCPGTQDEQTRYINKTTTIEVMECETTSTTPGGGDDTSKRNCCDDVDPLTEVFVINIASGKVFGTLDANGSWDRDIFLEAIGGGWGALTRPNGEAMNLMGATKAGSALNSDWTIMCPVFDAGCGVVGFQFTAQDGKLTYVGLTKNWAKTIWGIEGDGSTAWPENGYSRISVADDFNGTTAAVVERNVQAGTYLVCCAGVDGRGDASRGGASDKDLKSIIRVVPSSEVTTDYHLIGLTTFEYEWNDIANELFGMSGHVAEGFLAEELEYLYPAPDPSNPPTSKDDGHVWWHHHIDAHTRSTVPGAHKYYTFFNAELLDELIAAAKESN